MTSDRDAQMNHVLATGTRAISFRPIWIIVFLILIAIGVITFLAGLYAGDANRTWHAYLTNYLFWFSLGFGMVLFGPVMNMTIADWARPTKRLTEAVVPFLLLSFPMLWILYPGRYLIFSWILKPIPEKSYWLNMWSMFIRNSVGLIVLSGLALALIYFSAKEDRKISISEKDLKKENMEKEIEKRRELPAWRAQLRLSPAWAIIYGIVLSSVGLDLAMSLDPEWFSTLFPAYYFVNSFHMGVAAFAILSALSLRGLGLKPLIRPHYFHDLGKILFGFTLMSGWFFFSQFVVIWYGNLPDETRYLIARFRYDPWEGLSYIVLIITFLFPIFILVFRRIKMSPSLLSAVAILILVGYWIERLIIVAPTYWKGKDVPVGIPEIGIAAGFLGLIGLSVVLFLRRVPLLPVSDPLFLKFLKREQDQDLEEERKKFGFV
jgi:hypothetical protein